MSPSSQTSCPSSSPSHPSRLSHSSCLSSLSHGKFPLAICFTYGILHFHVTLSIHFEGFPGGQSDKESTCQCKRHKRWSLIPVFGKALAVGNGNALQYSCLGNSMDRGAWWVQSVHGVSESQTRLSDWAHRVGLQSNTGFPLAQQMGTWPPGALHWVNSSCSHTGYMTLDMFLNLSLFQFPHL